MKGNRIVIAMIIAILTLLLGTSAITNRAQAQQSDIVAYKTEQPFTLDGIPSESFWSQIPATTVPLEGTTTWGGNVPHMFVKAAHDGNQVFLMLQWPDLQEQRVSSGAVRLETSTPGNLVGRYLYNETYAYTDAGAVTWWMGSERPTVAPATNNEFGGSPTRQASLQGWTAGDDAELWIWKANNLDLGSPNWPHGIEETWNWGPNVGVGYTMPHSSAFSAVFNSTGNWVLGDGLLHSGGCQQPGTEPFDVSARGVWGSGMWTLEMARPYLASPENRPYTVEFGENNEYWITLAAFDGNKGEWEEVGSRSDWLSLELSSELVPFEQRAKDVEAAANEAVGAAGNAAGVAGDAARVAADAANEAVAAAEVAVGAEQVSQDALSAAQEARSAAEQALAASEDARNAGQTTMTIGLAAVGLAIVAILLAVIMGRKR